MRALSIICAVSNFIASTLGYMIILSLLLGFGNASVKGPWGAWRINAGSAPDSDGSPKGGDGTAPFTTARAEGIGITQLPHSAE